MFKFLALGLGVGAGVQAWRQFPPDGPVTPHAVALVFCVGLLSAFLGGLWFSRGKRGAYASASASAVSIAEAVASNTNTVNLAVVVPGRGAAAGVALPADRLPWMVDAAPVAEISADDLDGLDFSELMTPEPERAE